MSKFVVLFYLTPGTLTCNHALRLFPSLYYLLDNCEVRVNQFPLLEARLELQEPSLVLRPSPEELCSLARNIVTDILHVADLVPRLATHTHSSYLVSHYFIRYLCLINCM